MTRSTPTHTLPHPRSRGRALAAVAALLLAVLLSGCGLVAAFVPPLDVGDPLGVDGRDLSATFGAGPIDSQIVAHVDHTTTFDLPDLEQDLHGFSLASFYTNAGLETGVTLSGPLGALADSYPERFTVTGALVEASLADDVNGSVSFAQRFDLALPFERDGCEVSSCRYRYAGSEPLADVLDLELTDRADLATLVAVLVRGDEETPNRGSLRVAVEVDSTPGLGGFTATFTLVSTGSKIRLGG